MSAQFYNTVIVSTITLKSRALCLHTPYCKEPIGTIIEFRLFLIESRDFSDILERVKSSMVFTTGSVEALILVLLPTEHVQKKGLL